MSQHLKQGRRKLKFKHVEEVELFVKKKSYKMTELTFVSLFKEIIVCYDKLTMVKWMAGSCCTLREESHIPTKIMLEYFISLLWAMLAQWSYTRLRPMRSEFQSRPDLKRKSLIEVYQCPKLTDHNLDQLYVLVSSVIPTIYHDKTNRNGTRHGVKHQVNIH